MRKKKLWVREPRPKQKKAAVPVKKRGAKVDEAGRVLFDPKKYENWLA